MREDKLFKAVKGVDDDLICEMLEYRPEEDVKGDVSEGVMYYVPAGKRKAAMRLWRYPVTAAAALAIAGGVLFVINNNGGIPENMSGTTSEETIETAAETDNGEASAADETDTSVEETQAVASEVPAPVVPLKVVGSLNDYAAIYVDSYPEIPQSDFGKEYFIEMSTEEILEYYGFFNNIAELIANDEMIEIIDENTPHGIYTFSDGSVYDINVFTFEMKKEDMTCANKFTLTVGKKTKFGQEYCAYYEEVGIRFSGQNTAFYNEEKDILFSIFNFDGATLMFSGTVDEITSVDDVELKEWYEEKRKFEISYYDGTPIWAVCMFVNSRYMCFFNPNS